MTKKLEKTKEAQAGDKVEVHLSKEIYEGKLLESPKSDKDIILVKLGSGYNIGFNRKDVIELKVKKKQDLKENNFKIQKNPGKPNVAVIMTGGTIASKHDPVTGGVKWLNKPENLFYFYPELFEHVNVSEIEVLFMKGSENVGPKDWKKIAKSVKNYLNNSSIKGVIVTHGTDTLHYTASALSFFLGNLNKPVVLTYSQRSIDRASSDANLNLRCSSLASISDIAEVMIVGHASLNDDFCHAMPGTKTRKLHSSRRDAFKVVNSRPFARIYPDRIERTSRYNIRNENKKIKSDPKFGEVALLKFYPGQDPNILNYYERNFKGVVIEAFGLGQIATSEARLSWTSKLKEVIKKGLIVCFVSQTIYGRVDPFVYSTGRELEKTGALFLEDMLTETAFTKLGWVLGHKNWALSPEGIKKKMMKNFAGEFNDRLEE